MEEQTMTRTVSKVAMAVAVGVLGFAAIAAGFAGARGMTKPDLVIRKMVYSNTNDIQKVTVYYMNIGKKAVTSPFDILVRFDNKEINTIILDDDEVTLIDDIMISETSPGSHKFKIPVKDFNVAPKDFGMVEFMLMSFQEKPTKLPIDAYVDSGKVIKESKETNNVYSMVIDGEKLVLFDDGGDDGDLYKDKGLIVINGDMASSTAGYDFDSIIGKYSLNADMEMCLESFEFTLKVSPNATSTMLIDTIKAYAGGVIIGESKLVLGGMGGGDVAGPALYLGNMLLDTPLCLSASNSPMDMYLVTNIAGSTGVNYVQSEILTATYRSAGGSTFVDAGPFPAGIYVYSY